MNVKERQTIKNMLLPPTHILLSMKIHKKGRIVCLSFKSFGVEIFVYGSIYVWEYVNLGWATFSLKEYFDDLNLNDENDENDLNVSDFNYLNTVFPLLEALGLINFRDNSRRREASNKGNTVSENSFHFLQEFSLF
jgi:hypothetical protein